MPNVVRASLNSDKGDFLQVRFFDSKLTIESFCQKYRIRGHQKFMRRTNGEPMSLAVLGQFERALRELSYKAAARKPHAPDHLGAGTQLPEAMLRGRHFSHAFASLLIEFERECARGLSETASRMLPSLIQVGHRYSSPAQFAYAIENDILPRIEASSRHAIDDVTRKSCLIHLACAANELDCPAVAKEFFDNGQWYKSTLDANDLSDAVKFRMTQHRASHFMRRRSTCLATESAVRLCRKPPITLPTIART